MIGSLSDCSMIDWFSFWFPDWSVHWWLNYSINSCFHNVMILVLRNASLGNRFAGAGKLSTARTRDAVARWQNRFCTCVLILEIALKSRIIIRQNGVRSGFMHGQWMFFFMTERRSHQISKQREIQTGCAACTCTRALTEDGLLSASGVTVEWFEQYNKLRPP